MCFSTVFVFFSVQRRNKKEEEAEYWTPRLLGCFLLSQKVPFGSWVFDFSGPVNHFFLLVYKDKVFGFSSFGFSVFLVYTNDKLISLVYFLIMTFVYFLLINIILPREKRHHKVSRPVFFCRTHFYKNSCIIQKSIY